MIPAQSTNLQVLRGTFEEVRVYLGSEGEFSYAVDRKRIAIHDGITPGGVPLVRATGDNMTGPLTFIGAQNHAGVRLRNLSTFQRDRLPDIQPGMIIWNINKNRVEVVNQSRVWVGLAVIPEA
jgi:hypothetical protein